ncbi:MAG TPA: hypothetical protein PLB95_00395 [Syntrophales bacterium]|jgi:hypothetical protein|nr:hypothetical protein [Syntrophales bacterium]HOD99405.1 hypothetical protein [Syntrophales bacterium]HOH73325.1 hypothetical protein [Syntrophales bacterium]HPX80329.1 hypothetical protein [Syntrophales bacterium]HQB14029.1 hypothetical protein [Syntrophales bacterium]
MTRKETGSFRMKHPPDRQVAPAITEAVRNRKRNNELSCAQAERIAGQQQVDLAEIGVALDLLEVRIGKCQLGLFGYEPASKAVAPAVAVAPALAAAIREALAGGRLPCKAAWDIAARMKIGRKKVAAACEALRIKIKPCQLGAF